MLKNTKVIIIAAVILIASAATLFTMVGLAQGTETNKTIVEQSQYGETVSMAGTTSTASDTALQQASSEPSPSQNPETATPTATPGPECISEDAAVNVFSKTAADLFGIDKTDVITAAFISDPHKMWNITEGNDSCLIDAITGVIIRFSHDGVYTGGRIKLSSFQNSENSIRNDNYYIQAADKMVKEYLSDGRTIDNTKIDGVQFVWDDDSGGFDPNATGTVDVDCHVYMHTGYSYIFSFWGTENLELRTFSSHPTQDACKWGYYFEEDAPVNLPLYSPETSATWNTASGLTAGTTPQPSPTPAQ